MEERCALCSRDLTGFRANPTTCKVCKKVVCGRCHKNGVCSLCRQRMPKK